MKVKDFNSKAESLHSEHLNLLSELAKIRAKISELEEDNPNLEIIEKLIQATPHRDELGNLLNEAKRVMGRIEEIGIERRKIFKELIHTPAAELI